MLKAVLFLGGLSELSSVTGALLGSDSNAKRRKVDPETLKAQILERVRVDLRGFEHTSEQAFQDAPKHLRENRDFMMAVVQRNGWLLKYAAEELKEDEAIVLAAVEQTGFAFDFAARELKQDRDFVIKAVQKNGMALRWVPEEFKRDEAIVLAAVEKTGFAFRYAATELKQNRDFVMKAVWLNGDALQNAPRQFKSDDGIVLAAVEERGKAFKWADEELMQDRDFVLEAVQKNADVLNFVYDRFKGNREIVKAAATHGYPVLTAVQVENEGATQIVLYSLSAEELFRIDLESSDEETREGTRAKIKAKLEDQLAADGKTTFDGYKWFFADDPSARVTKVFGARKITPMDYIKELKARAS